jgi:hypothetical protein
MGAIFLGRMGEEGLLRGYAACIVRRNVEVVQ